MQSRPITLCADMTYLLVYMDAGVMILPQLG